MKICIVGAGAIGGTVGAIVAAVAAVGTTLALPGIPGDFRIGGGARYVGSRAGDPENSFTLPDYTVADTFIAWNSTLSGHKTRLQLNLNNLFDKHYYTSSGGNLRVREGETRNLVAEASIAF